MPESQKCGAWGGCPLPAGHNMGRADIPEAHAQPEKEEQIHPDLARLIERDRQAVAQGYRRGDVNHHVNPIIGILRLRLHHGAPFTTKDMEWAVEALTKAARAEIALLAYLNPEEYKHVAQE